jgi:prepilin-type N-terminal cleavage/methylation domain-containing protein
MIGINMTHGKALIISSFQDNRADTSDAGQPARFPASRRRQAGFTAIEVLIVVAIIAIVAAIAVPGIMRTLANMRANGAMYQVMESLRNARMLAMSQNNSVSVRFPANTADVVEVRIWDTASAGNFYDFTGNYETADTQWVNIRTVVPAANDPSVRSEVFSYQLIAGTGLSSDAAADVTNALTPDPGSNLAVGGPAGRLMFSEDGILMAIPNFDAPVNGTIFIGPPGDGSDNGLVRAVTILGATGRIDGWMLRDGTWRRVR